MGPLLIDIDGLTLTDEDKQLLASPFVGGVILFSRNYRDHDQLNSLVRQIRSVADRPFLISVDHEGGRVQRFKEGFTHIPPAQSFALLSPDLITAKSFAFDAGWMLAIELIAFDIDLSYAPVLDLGHDCLAIGSRSFHHNLDIAIKLASSMIDCMHAAGIKTTGKHLTGHGAVIADSHKETPIDDRSPNLIEKDMQIFAKLIANNKLDAIMPAHVIYSQFDDKPASASPFWLKHVLRQQLNFNGIIFSDDLSMEGAAILGSHGERAKAALSAGCDLLLACNNRQGTFAILEQLNVLNNITALSHNKASLLLKQNHISYDQLTKTDDWQHRHMRLMKLNEKWATYHASRSH